MAVISRHYIENRSFRQPTNPLQIHIFGYIIPQSHLLSLNHGEAIYAENPPQKGRAGS